MEKRPNNPFSLTQSAHMTDEQIHKLWVELSLDDIQKVTAVNPVIIKGGKGSGKTHLLRHHSFPLQLLRYKNENTHLLDRIIEDGYIGIYMRCGGLNASRFQKKGYSTEIWASLFEYALELLLADELLHILSSILEEIEIDQSILEQISQLFSIPPTQAKSIKDFTDYIHTLRNNLDLAVNNCALGVNLVSDQGAKIIVNRGNLIFGIPDILSKNIEQLKDINFVYLIDEYESFTDEQQKYVNTLIREKFTPSTVKIGVRKYGIKTSQTFSADEELVEGSEYEVLPLDEKLRSNITHYRKFSYELLKNRLSEIIPCDNELEIWAKDLFEEFDTSWSSKQVLELIEKKNTSKHIKRFYSELTDNLRLSESDANRVVENLRIDKYPLLEKTNFINFYKRLSDESNPLELSLSLSEDCNAFIQNEDRKETLTFKIWDYYKNDVVDQLLNDYGYSPYYTGIDNFIEMSEGMPRNLINILKHIYDWAVFKNEPIVTNKGRFSIEVQQKGVLKASEWCFNDMRKIGKDIELLQTAISRLAQIFKINHFSDRPSECSLISFGASVSEANEEAQRIIRIAEDRSLLIRIEKGHQDKNSGAQRTKYQINKMLCPRWGLPIASRGSTEFSADDLNIIFDCLNHNDEKFRGLAKTWKESRQAFSKKNTQSGLFD